MSTFTEPRGTDSPYAPEWKWQVWVMTKVDEGWEADEILGAFLPVDRPEIARYLNNMMAGFNLRSEFRSEAEAEAFWAHIGEDERIERSNLGEHGMAQVPDPGE